MSRVAIRFIQCFSILFCISTASINAQILQDTSSLNLIKRGVDYIYNMQFTRANEVYRKINHRYPGHPVVILFKGIITYWENYPLLTSSAARNSFEEEMRSCIEFSEKNINSSNEAEYLLADLCARGLLLNFYTNNELTNEVLPLASGTYQYIKRSFDFTSSYTDFFFFTGIYNYYREVYPNIHPVFKPITFFFRKGNRLKGLNELQTAAQNSILLKAESFSDLSYIYISYENNYQQAYSFSKYLHDLYPANPEYLAEYIKNLLLIKRYDEADSLILSTGPIEVSSYYQAQLSIFKGIIQEKKYRDNKQARKDYNAGIRDLAAFDGYGKEFAAYGYFGLSRIAGASGDKEEKKIFHKQAMKLADLKKINFD